MSILLILLNNFTHFTLQWSGISETLSDLPKRGQDSSAAVVETSMHLAQSLRESNLLLHGSRGLLGDGRYTKVLDIFTSIHEEPLRPKSRK